MKDALELTERIALSNNWLRLHGYAMKRCCGKRQGITKAQRKLCEKITKSGMDTVDYLNRFWEKYHNHSWIWDRRHRHV